MSAIRVQKIFEAIPEQLRRIGPYPTVDFRDMIRWQGRVASNNDLGWAGYDACVVDVDSATWADNNRRVVLVAEPAGEVTGELGFRTQSHAYGYFLDGSVRFHAYVETPESYTGAQNHFLRILQQHIVGQLGAPLRLHFSANDTEPTVKGVNGAGSSASYTDADWLLPYGMVYPGGV